MSRVVPWLRHHRLLRAVLLWLLVGAGWRPVLAEQAPLFVLHIQTPAPLDAWLLRHAELARFQSLPDLTPSELERLLSTASADMRQLLATQGHFSPRIDIRTQPALDTSAPASEATRYAVHVQVEPGPRTQVAQVDIRLTGDAASNPAARDQQQRVRQQWSLPAGQAFTQAQWEQAKTEALRQLSRERYPQARVAHSQADIDPDTHTAQLTLTLDSGPAYTWTTVAVEGTLRYSADTVRHMVALAGVHPGGHYDEDMLQKAQQRLMESGYFESAFVLIDPSDTPEHTTVRVRVREAPLQKVVAGVGGSTDNGFRLSLEHTHHRLTGTDWRAVSQLQLERDTRTVATTFTAPANGTGWQRLTGLQWQRQQDAARITTSQQWRLGRTLDTTVLTRGQFLQFDRALTDEAGITPPTPAASSVSAHLSWTQRLFDDLTAPRTGHGWSLQAGGGLTLSQAVKPYLRVHGRWQGFWSPAMAQASASRWSLRLEGGAIWSPQDLLVPSTQRFLAGGDNSVRGYATREIGVPGSTGQADPGRLLLAASLEWQRPLWQNGHRSAWESVWFLDSGGVANRLTDMRAHTGVGTGVRYLSPVGPLQADLAYGLKSRSWRLHMSVGFTF